MSTQTGVMTLTEFLLARIAEDPSRIGKQAVGGDDQHPAGEPCSYCEPTWAARSLLVGPDWPLEQRRDYELRALASIYRDHADYDEAWRP